MQAYCFRFYFLLVTVIIFAAMVLLLQFFLDKLPWQVFSLHSIFWHMGGGGGGEGDVRLDRNTAHRIAVSATFLGQLSSGTQGGFQKPVVQEKGPTCRFCGQFRCFCRDSQQDRKSHVYSKRDTACLILFCLIMSVRVGLIVCVFCSVCVLCGVCTLYGACTACAVCMNCVRVSTANRIVCICHVPHPEFSQDDWGVLLNAVCVFL